MGIREQTLSRELSSELTKLNKLEQQIKVVKDGLAVAAQGADRGKASTDKLERLEGERPALEASINRLRTEIAAAIRLERCH
jgi:hypothetical protein